MILNILTWIGIVLAVCILLGMVIVSWALSKFPDDILK